MEEVVVVVKEASGGGLIGEEKKPGRDREALILPHWVSVMHR